MRSEEVQKAFVKAALNAYRISNFSSCESLHLAVSEDGLAKAGDC